MAEIWGTPGPDQLDGTDENDIIRAGRGEDVIYSSLGDDILYGGYGNDTITDYDGRNEIYGGRGSDEIYFSRGIARGGYGNDSLHVGGGGWGVGGPGNDTFEGTGAFWGDAGPGASEIYTGNDKFLLYADADSARAHGGPGSDRFYIALDTEASSVGIIDDFHSGEDKLQVYVQPPDGESAYDLFGRFDANRNGVLEYTDSLSGGGVYVDVAANTMYLVFGTGFVTVHGTTEIAARDWLTDFGVA